MSRELAMRALRYCRQLALPRSGIVVALGLCAVFIFLSVGRFPVNQQFEVVSINGRDIAKPRPTFRVRWTLVADTWAFGSTGCNFWSNRVRSLRSGQLALTSGYHTAMACSPPAMQNEHEFDAALAKVKRWRSNGAQLILEGDSDVIRLALPIYRSRW